ncbi:MAG: O-antigen ligase family protein [Burkholderiaceae bacterium]
MTELSSIIFGIGGALFVLIALPAGLGLAMHAHTRFPRIGVPAMAAALSVVPAVGLILVGRNLSVRNLAFDGQIDPGGLSAWLFRLTSASVIAIAVTVAIVYLMRRTKEDPAGRIMLTGFIAFVVTNVVLNGLFGTVPSLVTDNLYAVLVISALYFTRVHGLADVLTAVKWGLFGLMAASILWMVVNPVIVMQTNTPEIRLPFLNFRFWGLGDGPNATGPLGLMLFLMTVYQPFRFRLLSLAAMGLGLLVMVLAQSMTTWIAAMVIIPPYFLIRYLSHPEKGEARKLSTSATIALLGVGGAAVLGAAALILDLNEVQRSVSELIGLSRGQERSALSGRAGIWAVAVRVFLENPLFGFGPTAWDLAFRAKINMFFAFHAHNLFFQAISVAGLFGLLGTIFYVSVMAWQAVKLTFYTRGLAPALFMMFMFRSISEVPLELSSILTGTFLMHMVLFHVLCAGAWEMSQAALKTVPNPSAPIPPRTVVPEPTQWTPPKPERISPLPPMPDLIPARSIAMDARSSPAAKPSNPSKPAEKTDQTNWPAVKPPVAPVASARPRPTPGPGTAASPGGKRASEPARKPAEPDQLGRVEPRLDI